MGIFSEYHQYREEVDTLVEISQFEQEILQLAEYKKTHPGKGIPEKKKSDIVKKARKGQDMFGKGKNFEKIAKSAGKKYGDEEAGKRVAGAIFWKKAKGKHMTKEDVDDLIWIIEDDLDIILDHAIKEGLASFLPNLGQRAIPVQAGQQQAGQEIGQQLSSLVDKVFDPSWLQLYYDFFLRQYQKFPNDPKVVQFGQTLLQAAQGGDMSVLKPFVQQYLHATPLHAQRI